VMGFSLADCFISPDLLPEGIYGDVQLAFLLITYAYILYQASNLISDGSELLLLVPAVAGIVGSIILPILGAVPDGAIVFFSGMGPDAQNQLSVGVGALAGSTIMLLTVPWFLSVVAGRVSISPDGSFSYTKKIKLDPATSWSLTKTGVQSGGDIKCGGGLMVLTAVSYLIIQIRATMVRADNDASQIASDEHVFALIGLITCCVFFVVYLVYQWMSSERQSSQATVDMIRQKFMSKGLVGIVDAFKGDFMKVAESKNLNKQYQSLNNAVSNSRFYEVLPDELKTRFRQFVRKNFDKYDKDHSGTMDMEEIRLVFYDMNERLEGNELKLLFETFDTDGDKVISFEEFVVGTAQFVFDHLQVTGQLDRKESIQGEETEEHEEEEEDEFANLDPKVRMRAIITKSCWMMFAGTALVLIFSDPMVDVLSHVGERTGIPAFYIAFVLAPLASNASELIAAYNYASKKTTTTILVSLSALQGAACMNNTFCLGVFLALIYFRGLVWEFSSETLVILLVQVMLALFALKSKQTLLDAILVILLYPASLALVSALEGYGWD